MAYVETIPATPPERGGGGGRAGVVGMAYVETILATPPDRADGERRLQSVRDQRGGRDLRPAPPRARLPALRGCVLLADRHGGDARRPVHDDRHQDAALDRI